jgi:lipoate-protein ligase B
LLIVLGFASSRWITSHGFSLNVTIDLSWFSHIIPCGLADKQVTSIAHEMKSQPLRNQQAGLADTSSNAFLLPLLQALSTQFNSALMLPLKESHPQLEQAIMNMVNGSNG